jgi:hypothetical protein
MFLSPSLFAIMHPQMYITLVRKIAKDASSNDKGALLPVVEDQIITAAVLLSRES